jgi:hypothetical protein
LLIYIPGSIPFDRSGEPWNHQDVTSSPCDLSMDEIPKEVYNGVAPQPTKAALEVEEDLS